MRRVAQPHHTLPNTLPIAIAVAALSLVPVANATTVSSVFDGRLPCIEQDGVQFCEGSRSTRVETWDGVPLDVNMTLPPASRDGPFPLVV